MKKVILLISAVLFLAFGLVAQIPSEGLVAHYPLNVTAVDISGNGNHGNMLGNFSNAEDRFGVTNGALEFNGSSNSISVSNQSPFNFSASITISVWVNIASASQGYLPLVNKWTSIQAPLGEGYYLGITPDNPRIRWNLGYTITTGSAIAINEWQHIAVTSTPDSAFIYLNGELDLAIAAAGTFETISAPFRIGRQSLSSTSHFEGLMDDVLLYDRALSPEEIQQLYNNDPTPVINIADNFEINIYPNPIQDYLTIQTNAESIAQIELIDSNGKLRSRYEANVIGSSIPMHHLESGYFILRFTLDDGRMYTSKLVKL